MRLSDAEWKVMKAVWDHQPSTARQVLNSVGNDTGWAYSTVKTMLTRLTDKGALSSEMRGNTAVYSPRISQGDAQRSAVRSLLDRAFGGAMAPMLRFMTDGSDLSAADRAAIRDLLQQTDEGAR